eukprot:PITA_16943
MWVWPTEKALHAWIKNHWKPKGDIDLYLGSKGFFTIVFANIEDKDRMFEGGPYFYAAAGLYMRPWVMNFVLERETFISMPMWIRLYSLPLDYWQPKSLKAIGNKLGHFIKISEATLRGKYTSFARICVEMDLFEALPNEIILEVYDEDWVQTVDCKHIPFKCCKFHEHGHLFRDCLGKKEPKKIYEEKQPSHNRFKISEEEEGVEREKQVSKDNPVVKEKDDSIEDRSDKSQQKEDQPSTMELDRDQEMTSTEVGTEEQEL